MPIVPNLLERLIIFKFNQGPGPLLDMWSGVTFRIVLAAIRLGVFEALADGPLPADALAAKIKTDPRGTRQLLTALEAMGYVKEQNGAYADTPMTAKWLLKRSANFGPGFEFLGISLSKLWDDLEGSLRTGQPALNLYAWIERQPEASRAFQEYMIAIAGYASGEIVRLVKLPNGAKRLLDIGGGHAAYALKFCQQHPDLRAVVFDSPQALNTGRANIAAASLQDRVTVQEGNFLTDELGEGYDTALLFNIVHGFSDDENGALIRRAARALRPGGLLVVAEQLAGRTPSPVANATKQILGMTYFQLLRGQLYAFEDVARWINADFANVRRLDSLRLPGTSLVIGERAR